MANDIDKRLSSWREAAGIVKRPAATDHSTDYPASHHRQQLAKSARLCMENLQAHEQFCLDLRAFVRRAGRDEETQQRVTDYAGYLLRLYENAGSSALERELVRLLQELAHEPREAVVVQTVHHPLPPRQSWFSRLWHR
jgi:hypothetical protein